MVDYYLGLDAGGTNLVAGVVDPGGHIISKEGISLGDDKSLETVTASMYEVSCAALQKAGIEWRDVPYWGIGMPSTVNAKTGLLVHANCYGWRNVPIFTWLQRYTDKRIYRENDANCAALAEREAGAGKNCDNMIMLTLGTGVGGGIILDGRLYRGANGLGAEPGHTKIVKGGRKCTCGKYGCLEAYASATALINRAVQVIQEHPESMLKRLYDRNELDGRTIFEALGSGDEQAKLIVDEWAEYLAAGMSSFVSLFRPEKIVLGGGLSAAGDMLLEPVRRYLAERSFGAEEIGVPEVVGAVLGNDAGIIGAAYTGINEGSEIKIA